MTMDAQERTLADILAGAASETLENLAFTELQPSPDPVLAKPVADYRRAGIGLDGKGTLEMAIDPALLEGLASTLYSMDPAELGEERIQDALREILNIIAGLFVAGMPGGSDEFALGLPLVHRDPAQLDACTVKLLLEADGQGELALGFAPPTEAMKGRT